MVGPHGGWAQPPPALASRAEFFATGGASSAAAPADDTEGVDALLFKALNTAMEEDCSVKSSYALDRWCGAAPGSLRPQGGLFAIQEGNPMRRALSPKP